MIYLLSAVLCSACINLGFTLGKHKKLRNLYLTWFNYFTATVVSLVVLLQKDLPKAGFSLSAMIGNMGGSITPEGSLTLALLFGAVTGVIYIGALLAIQYSILRNGPSPTTMFNRLGVILSVLLAMVMFGEQPTLLCWAGIALAMSALVVYNWSGAVKFDWLLVSAFVMGGVAEFSNKLFSAWCLPDFKPLFLLMVFGTACLIATVLVKKEGYKTLPNWKEVLLGAGIGCANLSASSLLLRALDTLPSGVVFPFMCAGVVLVIAFAGSVFFKERIGRRGWIAVGMTMVALVLINL